MRVLSLYKVDLSHSFEVNYPQLMTLEVGASMFSNDANGNMLTHGQSGLQLS